MLIRPSVMRTTDEAQEQAQKMRETFKGLENIPKDKLPPLPKWETPAKKRWNRP